MLLIGPAGVGKTTVAKVLADDKDLMFMNASMERGIDEVRNKIHAFASTTSLFGDYKVILLDEADNLTADAQKALRALIEQFKVTAVSSSHATIPTN
jgi:replication factor C small subunit